MTKKIDLDITNGFYRTQSSVFSSQRCINAYPVYAENPAYNKAMIVGTPGAVQIQTTGDIITGVPRGDIEVGEQLYRVSGNVFYRIKSDNSVEIIGALSYGDRCSLATNGDWIVIVNPGVDAWAYKISNDAWQEITDPDFIVSNTVVFIDGRFVFTASAGDVFFCSDLNNPLSYDALNFGTAETSPDGIVAAWVEHNQLYIFGTQTVEMFQNIGGSGFPFQRIPGAYIEKGLYGQYAIVNFNGTVCFVGGGINERAAIWAITSSNTVQKISTNAIDYEIQQFTKDQIDSFCVAATYASRGAFFAIFNFNSDLVSISGKTFCYDSTASSIAGYPVWHERVTTGATSWLVNDITFVYNKLYISYFINGNNVGYLDENTYEEFGRTISREIVTKPFVNMEMGLFLSNFELVMESGVGLTSGQGSDPEISMAYSDDGARTWSNWFTRTFGKLGEYGRRIFWRRIGYTPTSRVFKFRMTDPVKFVIIKATAYLNIGTR